MGMRDKKNGDGHALGTSCTWNMGGKGTKSKLGGGHEGWKVGEMRKVVNMKAIVCMGLVLSVAMGSEIK